MLTHFSALTISAPLLQELTGPITSPEGVPSAHSSPSKLAGLVTEQLRTTMSFT